MASSLALTKDAARPRAALSLTAAFYLQASITVTFLAGSIAPTPLYATYQAAWGFDSTMVTVVFAVYALAVLAALLTLGKLSDHVGRRPVLLVATLVQAATMLLFAAADSVHALLLARVIQGVAAGAAIAAVGAGLLDIDRTKGSMVNAIIPPLGTATGGLAAGLVVRFLPEPTHLIYLLLLAVYLAQAVGVWFMPEPAARHPGAWRSLLPRFSVPAAVRQPLLLVVPALVSTWALAGLYGSLAPTLLHSVLASDSPLTGGLAVFAMAVGGGVAVYVFRDLASRSMLRSGAATLFAGVAMTQVSLGLHSLPVFFLGTIIAGVGFGLGFQGAIRTVIPLAPAEHRGGVLSIVFLVAYLAMGLPVVFAGYLVTHGVDVLTMARGFGVGLMVLALLAFVGTLTPGVRRVRSIE